MKPFVGRPGKLGKAVRKIDPDRDRLDPVDALALEVLDTVADLADAARREGDAKLFMDAVKVLSADLSKMRVRSPGKGANGDDAGGTADELAGLLGSGPEVHDPAES